MLLDGIDNNINEHTDLKTVKKFYLLENPEVRSQNSEQFHTPKSRFFHHSDYWILNSKFPVCDFRQEFQLHHNNYSLSLLSD